MFSPLGIQLGLGSLCNPYQAKMPKNKNKNRNKRSPVRSVAVAYGSEQKYMDSAPRRLRHTEFIGEVEANDSFQVKSYALNPGLEKTFPWLYKQARGWQFYRFNKLTVRFVTRSPSDTPGSVIYVIDYRSQDPKPETESQATNAYGSREGPVWRNLSQGLDLKTASLVTKWKQVRAATTSEDLINFDVGRLHVCTVGLDGTVAPAQKAIGKLYLDFEVEFQTPELNDVDSQKKMTRSHSVLTADQVALPIIGTPVARSFTVPEKFDGLRLKDLYDPVNKTFLMPRGYYRFHVPQTITSTAVDAARHSILPMKNHVSVSGSANAHSGLSAMSVGNPGNKTSTSFIDYFDGIADVFSLVSYATSTGGAILGDVADCLVSLL
jgi:hypothetical protein